MGIFGGNRGNRNGPKKVALNPDDFEGDTLVVTVKGEPREYENFGRRNWAIDFAEHPGAIYYATYAQMKRLVALLGNDETQWDGQRIALEVTDVPNPSGAEGSTVRKFYACDARKNAETLRLYDAAAEESATPNAAGASGRKTRARGRQE